MKKEPTYVIAAREALAEARVKHSEAQQAEKLALEGIAAASAELRKAMEQADSVLPQCRSVTISRYSSGEQQAARVVILRKTAGGRLVVRRCGELDAEPMQFEWSKHAQVYREKCKRSSFFINSTLELRDVPADFLQVDA